MSDDAIITTCPTCAGAVRVVRGEDIRLTDGMTGIGYEATIRPEQIALALDNEQVARAVIAILPKELRLGIAGVCLGAVGEDRDGFFTTQDVEDEAEAGLRAHDVVKELRARNRFSEAAHFGGLSERHQRRAIRITALLTESEQMLIKQRVHGGPIGNGTPSHIEIVKS